jgi:hypothetical protein
LDNTTKPHTRDELLALGSPKIVLKEVLTILEMTLPGFDPQPVVTAYHLTIDLYEGNFPGYRSCNTGFHDLRHTVETFLAMARILHGAAVEGFAPAEREIMLGLTTALLHDSGYIQERHDKTGTGAKHTVSHIVRSMDFLDEHRQAFGIYDDEIPAIRDIILCTDLSADIASVAFADPRVELLGKLQGTVDMLAQMSDRIYLEKLLFLFHEFREANVGDYKSEIDLLEKTVAFFDFIDKRMKYTLDANDRLMVSHFSTRWNIPRNLYQDAINRQKNYLLQILSTSSADPRQYLRRNGIVEQVRSIYGAAG